MPPGDQADLRWLPGAPMTLEQLPDWLRQRVDQGDVEWVQMAYYSQETGLRFMNVGLDTADLAWVAAHLQDQAVHPEVHEIEDR